MGLPRKVTEAIRRKLRGLVAVLHDPAATDHERATARALKARLEKKLTEAGVPKGDWTDIAFRLGRGVQELKPSSKAAFRLGKMFRRALKK